MLVFRVTAAMMGSVEFVLVSVVVKELGDFDASESCEGGGAMSSSEQFGWWRNALPFSGDSALAAERRRGGM
jgi:hypothetical protein